MIRSRSEIYRRHSTITNLRLLCQAIDAAHARRQRAVQQPGQSLITLTPEEKAEEETLRAKARFERSQSIDDNAARREARRALQEFERQHYYAGFGGDGPSRWFSKMVKDEKGRPTLETVLPLTPRFQPRPSHPFSPLELEKRVLPLLDDKTAILQYSMASRDELLLVIWRKSKDGKAVQRLLRISCKSPKWPQSSSLESLKTLIDGCAEDMATGKISAR